MEKEIKEQYEKKSIKDMDVQLVVENQPLMKANSDGHLTSAVHNE